MVSTSTVTLIGIRALRNLYKSGRNVRQIIKHKKLAIDLIEKGKTDQSFLCSGIQILASLKNNYDKSFLYNIFDSTEPIDSMKKDVLKEHIFKLDHSIPDVNYSIGLFMTTMFYDGDYTNEDFLEAFSKLPDNHYQNLKKNIADTILFSRQKEQSAILNPNKIRFDNLLLKSMDTTFYQHYFSDRSEALIKFPIKILTGVKKQFEKNKNLAYEYYLTGGQTLSLGEFEPMSYWKDYIDTVFYTVLSKNVDNVKECAQELNIDKIYAEEIIEDLKTETLADNCDNLNEKVLMYKKRIQEKLKIPVMVYNTSQSFKSQEYYAYYENLNLRKNNIYSYINQSGVSGPLLEELKPNLDKLTEQISLYEYLYKNAKEEEENNPNNDCTKPVL